MSVLCSLWQVLAGHMADCSKFADRQRRSFCLRSCCVVINGRRLLPRWPV